MSGIPSLTILPEEQKFNGENLLQWKINMTQLLGSKGLLGYIDGKVPKPNTQPTSSFPMSTLPEAKDVPLPDDEPEGKPTPIYSTTPTLDEWVFRDQFT